MKQQKDITEEVLYLSLYTTSRNDADATAAIVMLGEEVNGETLIELNATLIDGVDNSDLAIICITGLGVEDGEIITSVDDAVQHFGVVASYLEDNAVAEQVARRMIALLEEGRLRFVYSVFNEEYPFDMDTDCPDEADHDAEGNKRHSFTTSFSVHFVNGEFAFPQEEDDPDEKFS